MARRTGTGNLVYWQKRLASLKGSTTSGEYRRGRAIVKDRAMIAEASRSPDPWNHLGYALAAMVVEATIAGDSRAEIERRVLAAYSEAEHRFNRRPAYLSRA